MFCNNPNCLVFHFFFKLGFLGSSFVFFIFFFINVIGIKILICVVDGEPPKIDDGILEEEKGELQKKVIGIPFSLFLYARTLMKKKISGQRELLFLSTESMLN